MSHDGGSILAIVPPQLMKPSLHSCAPCPIEGVGAECTCRAGSASSRAWGHVRRRPPLVTTLNVEPGREVVLVGERGERRESLGVLGGVGPKATRSAADWEHTCLLLDRLERGARQGCERDSGRSSGSSTWPRSPPFCGWITTMAPLRPAQRVHGIGLKLVRQREGDGVGDDLRREKVPQGGDRVGCATSGTGQ